MNSISRKLNDFIANEGHGNARDALNVALTTLDIERRKIVSLEAECARRAARIDELESGELFEAELGEICTDLRAGLRPCEYWFQADPESVYTGYFHQFYIDADGDAYALIETQDGSIVEPFASNIKFTDVKAGTQQ